MGTAICIFIVDTSITGMESFLRFQQKFLKTNFTKMPNLLSTKVLETTFCFSFPTGYQIPGPKFSLPERNRWNSRAGYILHQNPGVFQVTSFYTLPSLYGLEYFMPQDLNISSLVFCLLFTKQVSDSVTNSTTSHNPRISCKIMANHARYSVRSCELYFQNFLSIMSFNSVASSKCKDV